MRVRQPPSRDELEARLGDDRVTELLELVQHDPPDDSRYLHWDKLRFIKPLPDGVTSHEEWWFVASELRLRASHTLRQLHDDRGDEFWFSSTPDVNRRVRDATMTTSGQLESLAPIARADDREVYLFSTLIEEAITSSQLEGASTTRLVAREMLRTRRQPRDKSERMIFNNYSAMEFAKGLRGEQLTPEIIFELHRILGRGALDVPGAEGRFRSSDENVVVAGFDGEVIHTPPPASSLESRMRRLCDFANDGGDYVDPLLRAIILHFMIGYDHPFADGNGRVARALFYWKALSSGLNLLEFTSISRVLLRAPVQYSRAFVLSETAHRDLTYFIRYQLAAIERSIEELKSYLGRKFEERTQVEESLERSPFNHRLGQVIRRAVEKPWEPHTYRGHMELFGVSRITADKDLNELVRRGIMQRAKRGKVVEFLPVSNLVSALKASVVPGDHDS